ncbi:MAG: stage 0 sporulation family protein [Candidatus Electrothrix sp. YB6]
MTETKEQQHEKEASSGQQKKGNQAESRLYYYRLRFREQGPEFTARSNIADLTGGDVVLVETDHCPEPAAIVSRAAGPVEPDMERGCSYTIIRPATSEEQKKYAYLPVQEQQAAAFCRKRIAQHGLSMHLVRVERFFNGSKVIFYFTAEHRVDFRELVKDLVQEFRTRVEMRQIGVRHETKMTGGIGACGRELCCSSFLHKFDSVSIKMAKTQDLPLNPAKISGVCNRLLCCLTYEVENYKAIKREMPRVGRLLNYEGEVYRVVRVFALQGKVLAISREKGELMMTEEQWQAAKPVSRQTPNKAKSQGSKTGKKQTGRKNEPE